MRSRGFTLIEVVIAAALAALLAALVLGTFVGVQQAAARAAVGESIDTTARAVAGRLADALRDLHVDDLDLEPDDPVAFVPLPARPLRYRSVVGFDLAARAPLLSPARSSGQFREVHLDGDAVVVAGDGPRRTIGQGVGALAVTLERGGVGAWPSLLIEVVVDARDPVTPGATLRSAARVRVVLHNAGAR